MTRPLVEKDILLTPEQVAEAPEPVRQWLASLGGADKRREHNFILQRYGALSSADGLAICTSLEIKNILHLLSENLLACELLFACGCDHRASATGDCRGPIVTLADFLHHSDAADLGEVERGLGAINAALQRLRGDPDATIYQIDAEGEFRVHALTQRVINALWRRLMRLTERHHRHAMPEIGDLFQTVAR
jgi:hypothetical protein